MSDGNSDLAFVFAMEGEARPLIEALGLTRAAAVLQPELPGSVFAGEHRGLAIRVALSGRDRRFGVDRIGTETAVLSALRLLHGRRPDLIISAGTAGGFLSRSGAIGDVYLGTEPVCFHDHRIPIPGFDKYGIGSYPTAGTAELAAAIGAKPGRVSTGNSLELTAADAEQIERFGTHAKEMEAAAIAQIACDAGIPFLALKAITDLVDHHEPVQAAFERNFSAAVKRLSETALRLIELAAEPRFTQLLR